MASAVTNMPSDLALKDPRTIQYAYKVGILRGAALIVLLDCIANSWSSDPSSFTPNLLSTRVSLVIVACLCFMARHIEHIYLRTHPQRFFSSEQGEDPSL